jgi:aerobic carbon-monoxide dehydrogenase large subunit
MAQVTQRYVGTDVRRKEDAEFITGQARYTDDLSLPGMLWMYVVRSPFAHARIKSVDLSKALAAEGVVAAYSGEDLSGDWAS